MTGTANLFASIPTDLNEEFSQAILSRPGLTIERIVSRGHRSPEGFWYDQAWDEWVLVVRGRAGLEIEGHRTIVSLDRGDHLLIPAGVRHRVAWTSDGEDTVWLAVHIHSRGNL